MASVRPGRAQNTGAGAMAAFLDPQERASRLQAHRYAVPRWMIEASAERRAAGDWQGACAAARFDVAFDLPQVSARYGPDVAAALRDDLLALVPDLVRRHLPRVLSGCSTLVTDLTVVLAGYGVTADVPGATAPYLYLRTPSSVEGPQRISLRFGAVRHGSAPRTRSLGVLDWQACRYLWDARRTGELRARAGGGDRLPFLHADGTPRGAHELPVADPGAGDPVARAEWATLLYRRGRVAESLAVAGIDFDAAGPETPPRLRTTPETILARLALDVPGLAAEAGRLADLYPVTLLRTGERWRGCALLDFTGRGGDRRPRIEVVEQEVVGDVALLPPAFWQRLPDLELLRAGDVTPGQLHPLVAGALFPDLDTTAEPPAPTPLAPVRVRCRDEWHQVAFRDGRLDSPHSPQERQRENALRAFGGAVTGCFAVEHSVTSGVGRLPKALRAQLRDLFLRAQHGDTPGVLELLDAGMDPRVRDGGRRTLLHVLNLLDHEPLLPRLLAAGLDLEAVDHRNHTPLCVAVAEGGPAELVTALIGAGARIDVVDRAGLPLDQLIRKYRRTDLDFLRERVEKEHPGLGADRWYEWEKKNAAEEHEDDEDG
ncbi:ankyrin repeat domain-containing protein [Streptomyces sp. NPDC056921]|uniref:ankyrin repeat domain-containing protein n=1 Tax=Streptomyces sp. NPDC056921 TaxID=3345966 RepID=UPI00363D7695